MYLAKPRAPDAMERGALNESCQMKRNDTSFPKRFGP